MRSDDQETRSLVRLHVPRTQTLPIYLVQIGGLVLLSAFSFTGLGTLRSPHVIVGVATFGTLVLIAAVWLVLWLLGLIPFATVRRAAPDSKAVLRIVGLGLSRRQLLVDDAVLLEWSRVDDVGRNGDLSSQAYRSLHPRYRWDLWSGPHVQSLTLDAPPPESLQEAWSSQLGDLGISFALRRGGDSGEL